MKQKIDPPKLNRLTGQLIKLAKTYEIAKRKDEIKKLELEIKRLKGNSKH